VDRPARSTTVYFFGIKKKKERKNKVMPGLTISDGGVTLGAAPPIVGNGKGATVVHGQQVMRITFGGSNVLEEVLKHEADLKITFGKSMVRETPSA